MADLFEQAFISTFLSMLKIFFVVLGAGFLLRRKVVTEEILRGLSSVTVDVFLPCLSFTSVLRNFRPGSFEIWWVLPLAGVIMPLVGMFFAWLFFQHEFPEKRNMVPLASLHNGAFLILPLGSVLFPHQFQQFSLYVFLFVMGQSIPIWTIGKQMTTSSAQSKMHWKDMLTPPVVATLLAIFCVVTGLDGVFLPAATENRGWIIPLFSSFFAAMQLLGNAAVPLAIFILGGVLGGSAFRCRAFFKDTIRMLGVKYLLLPACTMALVYISDIGKSYPLLAIFFVIESASAPAIAIILQVKKYGGDEQKIASMLMIGYLVCLVMMPVWVAFWDLLAPSPFVL